MPAAIPVKLVAYNPEWPDMADAYAESIASIFGEVLIKLHHIGSTAVPGLIAKPIIDLIPVVTTLRDFDLKQEKLEAAGYAWHGEFGILGRRFLTLEKGGIRLANVHAFAAGAPEITRHLVFREYLRAHPEIASAYAAEKRRARDLHPGDSHAYTDEKSTWIRRVEADALEWAQHGLTPAVIAP